MWRVCLSITVLLSKTNKHLWVKFSIGSLCSRLAGGFIFSQCQSSTYNPWFAWSSNHTLYLFSKKWLVILKIATWLEIYVSPGSATCIWNIFQYWCILNKTKKSFLWVCVLKIKLQKYGFSTIGKAVGCVEWNYCVSQADWKDWTYICDLERYVNIKSVFIICH